MTVKGKELMDKILATNEYVKLGKLAKEVSDALNADEVTMGEYINLFYVLNKRMDATYD